MKIKNFKKYFFENMLSFAEIEREELADNYLDYYEGQVIADRAELEAGTFDEDEAAKTAGYVGIFDYLTKVKKEKVITFSELTDIQGLFWPKSSDDVLNDAEAQRLEKVEQFNSLEKLAENYELVINGILGNLGCDIVNVIWSKKSNSCYITIAAAATTENVDAADIGYRWNVEREEFYSEFGYSDDDNIVIRLSDHEPGGCFDGYGEKNYRSAFVSFVIGAR